MTLTAKATDAMVQALNYIHEHPEEWHQGWWIAFVDENGTIRSEVGREKVGSCGTIACLAGRIALQQPEFELYESEKYDWLYGDSVVYQGEPRDIGNAVVNFLIDGSTNPVEDGDTLYCAFHSTNSEGDLWYYALKVADRPLDVPEGVEVPSDEEVGERYAEPDDLEF